MTLKEFCKKYNLTEDEATGKKEIGGYLYLRSVTSLPEGFNPTVGGSLHLRSVTSLPEGFNPTVGGYLDLSSVTSLPEGFNPTVGGSLYLRSKYVFVGAKVTPPYINARYLWRNKEYIKVDGIFTRIISERGNVMRVQRIAHKEVEYLVTDGDGRLAHGATLKEAKESLIYKIADRDSSKYKEWKKDTIVTHAEAIEAYRVITGACALGTRHFCESVLCENKKDKYTIAEVIELTKGLYGAETFKNFFS